MCEAFRSFFLHRFAVQGAKVRKEQLTLIGSRIRHVRASSTQDEMAQRLGVAKRTYQNYERAERLPDAEFLARLVASGWNANWLLTGDGPERLDLVAEGFGTEMEPASAEMSQAARPEDITLAVQLAEEALDGTRLEPVDYGKLVALIYGALVNGLPSAQILAFAKPAARGIRGSDSESMDRTGKTAAG